MKYSTHLLNYTTVCSLIKTAPITIQSETSKYNNNNNNNL